MTYCSFPRSVPWGFAVCSFGFITVFMSERSCMDFSSCLQINTRKSSDSPCEAAGDASRKPPRTIPIPPISQSTNSPVNQVALVYWDNPTTVCDIDKPPFASGFFRCSVDVHWPRGESTRIPSAQHHRGHAVGPGPLGGSGGSPMMAGSASLSKAAPPERSAQRLP